MNSQFRCSSDKKKEREGGRAERAASNEDCSEQSSFPPFHLLALNFRELQEEDTNLSELDLLSCKIE